MHAWVGENRIEFRVFARPSAYDPEEVVLHGYEGGALRALQLTFNATSLPGRVNSEMTGYWDLAFCTPSNAYRMVDASVSEVRFDPETRRLTGRFSLRVTNENPPHDSIDFDSGSFDVRLRAATFGYCVEG